MVLNRVLMWKNYHLNWIKKKLVWNSDDVVSIEKKTSILYGTSSKWWTKYPKKYIECYYKIHELFVVFVAINIWVYNSVCYFMDWITKSAIDWYLLYFCLQCRIKSIRWIYTKLITSWLSRLVFYLETDAKTREKYTNTFNDQIKSFRTFLQIRMR